MKIRTRLSTLLLVAGLATAAVAAADSPAVTGDVQTYRVMTGDTIALVAARFGIEPPLLARDNGLAATARLRPGDELEIDNRHIVPAAMPDGIVINLPQRRLFLFKGGSMTKSYPVAVGSGGWRTPVGAFTIQNMEIDPTWDVPKSIQAEMASKGKRVLTRVPPGPDNPLGTRWIALTSSIGIHGTNAPSSIFKYSTHGCVRMATEDVEELFGQVSKGMPVSIIYQPLLVAKDGNDIFVEVHRDPYGRGGATRADLERALAAIGASDAAAGPQIDTVLKLREGRAVSLKALTAAGSSQR